MACPADSSAAEGYKHQSGELFVPLTAEDDAVFAGFAHLAFVGGHGFSPLYCGRTIALANIYIRIEKGISTALIGSDKNRCGSVSSKFAGTIEVVDHRETD